MQAINDKQNNFKGYGEISSIFWTSIIRRAKDRNKKFDLDIKDAWELFLKQGRKCALSGMDIKFAETKKKYLARIDSSRGYILDNVQWVYKKINCMKLDLKDEEFINICKTIADYNRAKELNE